MRTHIRTWVVAAAATAALGGASGARGAVRGDPDPTAPLSGPAVAPAAQAPTLVERDLDGKVKRLDRTPAEAAARLLNMPADVRAKVDQILAERAALLDALVRDHLREIAEIAQAAQAGDKAGARAKLMELAPYAGDLRERGQLAQELDGVLPPALAAEVRRLTLEYGQAVVAEEEAAAKAAGTVPNTRATVRREGLRLIGEEVRRSYERVVGQRVRDFEKIIAALQLSPEQEGQVRKIVGDLFTSTYGKGTPAQRAAAFGEVWKVLSSDQRQTLTEEYRRRQADEPAKDDEPMGAPK